MRRGIGRKVFGLVLVLLLVIVGGYALGYAGPTGVGGVWEVTALSVADQDQALIDDVLKDHPMTVSFIDGELVMDGPCNSQTSRYFRVGDRLISVPGFRTSKLCHWDGFTDGQVSDLDRIFHRPGNWLSSIDETTETPKLLWSGRGVDVVLTEVPSE